MARFQQWSAVLLLGSTLGWLGFSAVVKAAPEEQLMAPVGEPLGAAIAQNVPPQNYIILHVNPAVGNDVRGDGTQMNPYKTISYALEIANPNTLILLASGTYSLETGESFPLRLRSGVTIQGAAGPNTGDVIIRGGGAYNSATEGVQPVTILGADNAGIANVTVSNPHPKGIGLWIESGSPIILENAFYQNGSTGIYIAGNGSPIIRNNYFLENGIAGLVIAGPSSAQVQSNVFENTGTGISVAPGATPQILENQITRNQDGLIVHAEAQPKLENNEISRNRRNSILEYGSWTNVATAGSAVSPPLPPSGSTPASVVPEPPSAPSPPPAEAAAPLPAVSAATSPAPTPATASPPIPTPDPIATAAVAASESSTAAVDLPASPSPLAAEPLLTPNLADDLRETTSTLRSVELAVVPTVPATAALSTVNLTPMQRGTEQLVEVAIAAPETPTTEPAASATPAVGQPTPSQRARRVVPQDFDRATPSAVGSGSDRPQASSEGSATAEAVSIPIIPPPVETVAKPAEPAAESGNLAAPEPTDMLQTGGDLPALPASATTSAAEETARLMVPDLSIPVGSGGGDLPEVFTAGTVSALPAAGPPPPPSRASTLGLNYKVLVEAADPAAQAQVRQHVADAFRVQMNGQTFMQVGAYPNAEEAQAQVDRLNQVGLRAQIEQIP